jgi:hypothetical protein
VTEAYQLGAVIGVGVSGLIVAAAQHDGHFVAGVQAAMGLAAALCLAAALAARGLLPRR